MITSEDVDLNEKPTTIETVDEYCSLINIHMIRMPPLWLTYRKALFLKKHLLQMDDATIELYFENADLQNFVKQIEDLFDISFIMDDHLGRYRKMSKRSRVIK